jgi:hypothetical protein
MPRWVPRGVVRPEDGTMVTPVRVLILEDRPADAEFHGGGVGADRSRHGSDPCGDRGAVTPLPRPGPDPGRLLTKALDNADHDAPIPRLSPCGRDSGSAAEVFVTSCDPLPHVLGCGEGLPAAADGPPPPCCCVFSRSHRLLRSRDRLGCRAVSCIGHLPQRLRCHGNPPSSQARASLPSYKPQTRYPGPAPTTPNTGCTPS